MYEETGCSQEADASAMELHLQNQIAMNTNINTFGEIHFQPRQYGQPDWEGALHNVDLENLGYNITVGHSMSEPPNPPTPDLLSIMSASSAIYDPLFHLNLPPQPPFIRELYQSPSNGYAKSGCLLGMDDQTGQGMVFPNANTGQFDNGILEFTQDIGGCTGKGRRSGKIKRFTTERERRTHLNDRFEGLKILIPSPTKGDRASIVGDAINYIKELLRTVADLNLLVERKRCVRNRSKKPKTEEDSENKPQSEIDQSFSNLSLRSSWLQRKSKVTEVDVRIVDDEVTIKLVQKKKINCVLFVSKVLDQLQLDLHHVAGGQIGEHYSFLFNTKICEGSSVYASAIANKIIEVVEEHYMAALPTSRH